MNQVAEYEYEWYLKMAGGIFERNTIKETLQEYVWSKALGIPFEKFSAYEIKPVKLKALEKEWFKLIGKDLDTLEKKFEFFSNPIYGIRI